MSMPGNKQLLFSVTKKDFDITFFSGTGAGGQYRNKHQNCVRLKHKATGVITTGQSHRSKVANMREAFQGMVKHPLFRRWLFGKVHKVEEKEKLLHEKVQRMMSPENLVIEQKVDGKWVPMQ